MADVSEPLEFELHDVSAIPDLTNICQLDDGTLFYSSESELYVMWNGQRFNANLSKECPGTGPISMFGMGAIKDAVYFAECRGSKIYKATFACPRINITAVRDMMEDEVVYGCATCSIIRGGKQFAYRMDQDPGKDGIAYEPRGNAIGLAGGKVFLEIRPQKDIHWLCDLENTYLVGDNRASISIYRTQVYTRCNSPYTYVTNGQHLAVICNGRQFPVAFRGIDNIHSIIGVHNRRISVVATLCGHTGIWTARLKNLEQTQTPTDKILDCLHDMKMELMQILEGNTKAVEQGSSDICSYLGGFDDQLVKINQEMEKIRLQREKSTDSKGSTKK